MRHSVSSRTEPPASCMSTLIHMCIYWIMSHELSRTVCMSDTLCRSRMKTPASFIFTLICTLMVCAYLQHWYVCVCIHKDCVKHVTHVNEPCHTCEKKHITCLLQHHFDRRKPPPPRGGFLFGRFPNQEPGWREPLLKHLVQILRGGSSWLRNPPNRKPSRGGCVFLRSTCVSCRHTKETHHVQTDTYKRDRWCAKRDLWKRPIMCSKETYKREPL